MVTQWAKFPFPVSILPLFSSFQHEPGNVEANEMQGILGTIFRKAMINTALHCTQGDYSPQDALHLIS